MKKITNSEQLKYLDLGDLIYTPQYKTYWLVSGTSNDDFYCLMSLKGDNSWFADSEVSNLDELGYLLLEASMKEEMYYLPQDKYEITIK